MGIKTLLMTDDESCVDPMITALESRFALQGLYVCPGPLSALYLGSYHNPDALFIDENFGEAVVTGVIEELKRELTPSRFILLTNDGGDEEEARARAYGAHDHLPRAMAARDLSRCLGKLAGRDDGNSHGATLNPAPVSAGAFAGEALVDA